MARLPDTYKPTHYVLTIIPELDLNFFEGLVKIDYINGAPNTNITLHSSGLEIQTGWIHKPGDPENRTNRLKKVDYDSENETATLEFNEGTLPAGTLVLKYIGQFNDRMKGFYRTSFELNGKISHAATTHFEPTYARRAFPCFDEPALRATFDLNIIYQPTEHSCAVSNMPMKSQKPWQGGFEWKVEGPDARKLEISFDRTPSMSTYLLAFCVGDFEYIENIEGKRPVRVYTCVGKEEQGQFALDVACKALKFYEDYFGIDYALPKLDLIAIPDFLIGAMENWGLVTYRETRLLVDPKNTSTDAKQLVALVIAHELAHQWFGNLVTINWWTHLWLKEGFASFMEYVCVEHIFPEYEIWSRFLCDDHGVAMDLDALHNSHPIEVPIKHASEISNIFDAISYHKGASVIRMLNTYIGDKAFRKGLNSYLKKFSYGSAVTEDLWAALETASDKPVRELMSGWTLQTGYPWLSISRDGSKLSLKQSRFISDGEMSDEESKAKWMIPISALNGEEEIVSLGVMKDKEMVVEITNKRWTKLNPGTIGLYRCAYPEDMMKELLAAVEAKELDLTNRYSLISDSLALCQAGIISTVKLLDLLHSFEDEDDFIVWSAIDLIMRKMSVLLLGTGYLDKFQAYGRNLYQKIFRSLYWTPKIGEDDNQSMLRASVLSRLVSLGDKGVVAEALRQYKDQLTKGVTIEADHRYAVYKAVAMFGDDKQFNNLIHLHRTSTLAEDKVCIEKSLGSVQSLARVERVIKFAFSDQVRLQDKNFVLCNIGLTYPQISFKLLQDKKDYFREQYEGSRMMTDLVRFSAANFASDEMAEKVSVFFEQNKFPGVERDIQQVIETIKINAKWLARDGEAIKSYLSSQ